jgi:predicted dehydrogenase
MAGTRGVLRAGLIGLGMMGRHHARVLGSLEGVELVGIADESPDAHRSGPAAPLVRGLEELLALGLDYCVVAVPTYLHEQLGLRLAEAGVHALIEKPLTQDLASSARLATTFDRHGLIGAVGHIERYNPALQNARARIAEGELGRVYQVATRRQGPFPARIADVGVIMDLATHDIDLTAWVVQQPYTSVSAQTAHRSGREHEDLVSATCRMGDGIVANHLVNWLSPLKERVTTITGEKGALVADTLTADLTFYANGTVATTWADIMQFRGVTEGDVTRYAISKPEPLRVEHEQFRNAVLGQDADIVTMAQGMRTVAVASALTESARTLTTVALTEERLE